MHYQALIHHYGYILLFLAMCINFTTLLVFAGIAAHLGYMSLLGSMVAVCVGSIFLRNFIFSLVVVGQRDSLRAMSIGKRKWTILIIGLSIIIRGLSSVIGLFWVFV